MGYAGVGFTKRSDLTGKQIWLCNHSHVALGAVRQPICYELVQGFRVTCLFTGLYYTKCYDTITDVI